MATPENVTSSSRLGNVTRYEDIKEQAQFKGRQDLGKQDFLTLFTAQLQNQNPLDPVKNEAFVAQLAQFSQLEALTNMQTSLDTFVKAMSSERLLGSAALIGKKVSVTDSMTALDPQTGIEGSLNLPTGAGGVTVTVSDSKGNPVRQLVLGPQNPGTTRLQWDGLDAAGKAAPPGLYRLTAKAVVNGTNSDIPVQTLSTVRGISTNPADGSVSLEVDGGKTVLLTSVQRVGL
jgi:flagellar basal-body rod modification protein FlgD